MILQFICMWLVLSIIKQKIKQLIERTQLMENLTEFLTELILHQHQNETLVSAIFKPHVKQLKPRNVQNLVEQKKNILISQFLGQQSKEQQQQFTHKNTKQVLLSFGNTPSKLKKQPIQHNTQQQKNNGYASQSRYNSNKNESYLAKKKQKIPNCSVKIVDLSKYSNLNKSHKKVNESNTKSTLTTKHFEQSIQHSPTNKFYFDLSNLIHSPNEKKLFSSPKQKNDMLTANQVNKLKTKAPSKPIAISINLPESEEQQQPENGKVFIKQISNDIRNLIQKINKN